MLAIELLEEMDLLLLFRRREVRVLQIAHHGVGFHLGQVHVAAGVGTGKKSVTPVGEGAPRLRTWGHGDKSWKVLIFGAQSIDEPRPHARTVGLQCAHVHHHHCTGVLWDVCVHRVDEADVVDAAADVRENIANPFTGLAVLPEGKGRGHQPVFGVAERLAVDRIRALARMFC